MHLPTININISGGKWFHPWLSGPHAEVSLSKILKPKLLLMVIPLDM